ncbi:MAG TPA: type II secretion system F family protein [Acidimicrobiia bacterium]|nr:type II secretion system F family protein [Acidimicrobiia bacterium]
MTVLGFRPIPIEVRLRTPTGTLLGLAGGIAAWALARSLGGPPAVAVAAGVLATPVPVSFRRASVRRRAIHESSRWPDFLAAVRSRIATGASLSEATSAAARHLGGRFVDLDRGPGEPFSASLRRVRSDWADPLADRVLTTLGIAAEVGGRHVDAVLAALATSVGDELRLRRAHDAALTQQRLTAGVALVAPWAMLALSIVTNPTAADSYSSPTGTWIVLGGLAATVTGFLLARRAARLSEPPRVFS